jgi:hypothetical protein
VIARLVCRLVLDVLEAQPAISSVKRDLLPYLVRTQVCAHLVSPSFAEPPTPAQRSDKGSTLRDQPTSQRIGSERAANMDRTEALAPVRGRVARKRNRVIEMRAGRCNSEPVCGLGARAAVLSPLTAQKAPLRLWLIPFRAEALKPMNAYCDTWFLDCLEYLSVSRLSLAQPVAAIPNPRPLLAACCGAVFPSWRLEQWRRPRVSGGLGQQRGGGGGRPVPGGGHVARPAARPARGAQKVRGVPGHARQVLQQAQLAAAVHRSQPGGEPSIGPRTQADAGR